MKINKIQALTLFVAVALIGFSAGFFTGDQNRQNAQVIKSLNSSATPTNVAPRIQTPTARPISNLSWKRFTSQGGERYTELPTSSISMITNFCIDLLSNGNTIANTNTNNSAKLAFQALDGKYYCLNPNGTAGGMCGNGSASGCQQSGCCGSCLGGVLPPGVTDLGQLSNLVFIPNKIIEAIRTDR